MFVSFRSERSLVVLEWLGIDQDEEHPAHAVAPIRPGMVRPALDQHVARAHEGLILVQDRPDLALETDRVVHGVGRVEPWVPRRALRRGLAAAPAEVFRGVRA